MHSYTPKLHLYLHTPVPVFKARVNMPGTITYPVGDLTFDGVTLGTYAEAFTNRTLLLGTTEGADDLGRTRIKEPPATSSNISIARASKGIEDGELDIQDNAYITVLDDYRVWAKLPFFDLTAKIDYKDGNIQVETYNTAMVPVANCGPGFADYIDPDTSVITVTFTDASFAIEDGETITAYQWFFDDGTVTVGTATDATCTVTFPAGFRWVGLTATCSNGETFTARCPVLAVDPDDDPTLQHYQATQRLEIGKNTLEIELLQDALRSDYPDGTLVMFWWDGPADPTDRSHMKFIGWVDSESHQMMSNKSGYRESTRLRCLDVAGRLDVLPGFPQVLSRVEDESPWSYMPSLDAAKNLHYLLQWHSTALVVADFTMPDDLVDYDAMRLDSGAASLLQQVAQQTDKLVPDHRLTCNAQGQLVVRADWMYQDEVDRPEIDPVITEDDWNDMSLEYNRHPKVHVLRSAAILSSTAFVTVDGEETIPVVQSIAPGNAEAFSQGTREQSENEGLALTQDALNACEGHRYALLNSRFGNFSFTDPSRNVFWSYEPALLKRVQIDIGASFGTRRSLPFTEAIIQVQDVSVKYSANKKGTFLDVSVSAIKEEIGYPAATYVSEDVEDVGYTPPALPATPHFGLIPTQELVAGVGIYHFFRTSDFQTTSGSGGPTWDAVAMTTDVVEEIYSWVVDPFSPGYIGTGTDINGFIATSAKIYKVTDIFGACTRSTLHTFTYSIGSGGGANQHFRTIQASFGEYQVDMADNPWLVCVSHYRNTSGHTGTWATYSDDGGVTWSSEVQISTHYDSGATISDRRAVGLYCSPKTPGLAYTTACTTTATPPTYDGFVTTDWGATWTAMTDPDIQSGQRAGGDIHVPWPTNDNEDIVYHGKATMGATYQYRLMRVTGTTIEDISPVSSAINYGVVGYGFTIRTYDSDRIYVVACCTGNDTNASLATNKDGVWVSSDNGDTWTEVIAPVAASNTDEGFHAAFSGTDRNVLFVWGGMSSGTEPVIQFSDDFGATFDDRTGNVASTYDTGAYGAAHFRGIAGGPTA